MLLFLSQRAEFFITLQNTGNSLGVSSWDMSRFSQVTSRTWSWIDHAMRARSEKFMWLLHFEKVTKNCFARAIQIPKSWLMSRYVILSIALMRHALLYHDPRSQDLITHNLPSTSCSTWRIETAPGTASSRLAMAFIRVDLPYPFLPTKPYLEW